MSDGKGSPANSGKGTGGDRRRRVAVMIDLDEVVVHHYQIFAGIQQYAKEKGNWQCSINPHAELLLAKHKPGNGPDGVVGRATRQLAELSRKTGVPVVNVWWNSPAQDLPAVLHDGEEAGRMAARHLLGRGLHNFGFLGMSRLRSSQMQLAGFRDVIGEGRHGCLVSMQPSSYASDRANWERFQSSMRQWIETFPRPIGIFATHDVLGRYFIEMCQEMSLNVPLDVAVIGASNEPVVCTRAVPSMSSIDYGFEQIGYQAAQLLDQLMDGKVPQQLNITLKPARLEARQSSDAFVVDDPLVGQAMRFIAEHGHEPIDVEDVAAAAMTTSRTLGRAFQRELGQTIYDAITHLRIERAKRQLMETGAVLKAVAADCGFRDGIHLSSVFQRVEGVSPSQYRQQRGWKK